MILVFKKIACLVVALIIFSFSVNAKENFFEYKHDNAEIVKILGISETELTDYCTDNSVTYLAVNSDNTKQIKKTEITDEFSKRIFDMSVLGDDDILGLASELAGIPDTKGEIIEYEGRKFLKTEHETQDSGGKFTVTQYITVEKSKKTSVAFYTGENTDKTYIWENFKKLAKPQKDYSLFLILGLCVFAFVGVWVLVLLIRDFKKE